ncbi:FecR family protein [Methylomonas albis]|uniref:FecR domain-containing protein n=1 Tax=Methylomonas albis TaxID=1854563 RepID=A0ABR9CX04_9GAMM|nr:FecR domain-containing protein [Methylomonas albis]MBD9355240.1 FecR domain-containing protein [Methylomonas albis]
MKSKSYKLTGTPQEQAGFWVFTQHSDEWTTAAEQQLQDWLAQHDSNRLEYERALKLWQQLDQLKPASFPARQAAQQIRAKRMQRKQLVRKIKDTGLMGLLVLTTIFGLNEYRMTDCYATALGERKSIDLADGSQIILNTDTQLSVKMTDNHRVLSLAKGEVYVSVAHEVDRPFDVIAGNGRIHDIGTRFNVYSANNTTQVTVAEGKVQIIPDSKITGARWLDHVISRSAFWLQLSSTPSNDESPTLVVGQQISYDDQGEVNAPIANAANVIAWRSGRLVFEMAPLEAVLSQVQRYHKISFQYSGEAIKQIRVSASFEIDNLPKILNTLQAALPIKTQQLQDGKIMVSFTRG